MSWTGKYHPGASVLYRGEVGVVTRAARLHGRARLWLKMIDGTKRRLSNSAGLSRLDVTHVGRDLLHGKPHPRCAAPMRPVFSIGGALLGFACSACYQIADRLGVTEREKVRQERAARQVDR